MNMGRHIAAGGFTIVELMMVVAIVGVLSMLALPSMRTVVLNSRMRSLSLDIYSSLALARSEAVKRNRRVLVCPAGASANTCGGGTDWAIGWLVCVDADANGACDTPTASVPNPLRVKAAAQAITVTGPNGAMRFSGGGEAPVAYSFGVSGTWSGSAVKTVVVETSGMIRN